jgi:hypothetical protein
VSVVPHVGDLPDQLDHACVRFPYPGSVTSGPRSGFKAGVSPNWYGSHYSSVRPANNFFSIFSTELEL